MQLSHHSELQRHHPDRGNSQGQVRTVASRRSTVRDHAVVRAASHQMVQGMHSRCSSMQSCCFAVHDPTEQCLRCLHPESICCTEEALHSTKERNKLQITATLSTCMDSLLQCLAVAALRLQTAHVHPMPCPTGHAQFTSQARPSSCQHSSFGANNLQGPAEK
jgi:hypothetical protein